MSIISPAPLNIAASISSTLPLAPMTIAPANENMNIIVAMKAIMQPAPHHQPLRPVSCRRRKVRGIIASPSTNDTMPPSIGVQLYKRLRINTTRYVHQYSERRARPVNCVTLLVASFKASERLSCGSGVETFMV